jgi:hypothetical protein
LDQGDLLRHAVEVLEQMDITYMVVGSIASGAHGEPRMTHDIDIVVKLQRDDVYPLCAAFPSPDFYISPDAVRQAIHNGGMFNVIHGSSGNKIDFMIAGTDMWGRTQIARRERKELIEGSAIYVARPEDIILSKLRYYQQGESEKHLRDIAGILRVSGDEVDRAYIDQWANELEVNEIWQAVQRRVERPD